MTNVIDVRAVVITEPGPPEVMDVREVPDLEPAWGEVLIHVAATAVNRADLLQRQGFYPPPPGASEYPGMECSGTIAKLGDGVTRWKVGDEVCALLAGGGYAEQVVVPADHVFPVPAGMSLIDAAAIPEAACTVWSMVFDIGGLQSGQTFLVHGGTSGIGTFAIQFARQAGAQVIATVGTARKVAAAAQLGAFSAINYHEEDFVQVVRKVTEGRGVDVILDNMGAVYLQRNVDTLARDGRLVILGLQGGVKGELNIATLLAKRGSIHAASLRARSEADKARIVAATQDRFWPLFEAKTVRPVIDRTLRLEDVVEAHRLIESSEHIGKVVLRVR
jgi:putative PIG3 family NAD(P)H quinone oxidoreductase